MLELVALGPRERRRIAVGPALRFEQRRSPRRTLRPQRPWRWIITVAMFGPIVQLLAYLFLTEKPYRAQIYESFLGFLTGIAGAYGGSVLRHAIDELRK